MARGRKVLVIGVFIARKAKRPEEAEKTLRAEHAHCNFKSRQRFLSNTNTRQIRTADS